MAHEATEPVDGNWVAEAVRRLGGMTKTVVALGISDETIARWRRLHKVQSVDALLKLSALTGISVDLLARGLPSAESDSRTTAA